MPTTHKALLYKEPHGKYTLEEIPTPSPGKGEVLVKVHSVALNPVDWKVPKYHPEATSLLLANGYPGILGCDVAGEVTDIGEDVTTFDKHDRVFGQSEKYNDGHGGFQQFTLMSADTISKIPPSLTYDAASTIPLGLSTSYSGFYAEEPDGLGLTSPAEGGFGKYKNIPIVILGGATSVGQYAIQLAKISGFSPIITTASLKHADVLKTYGATHVLDRNLSTTQTISTIKSITEKEITLAYDGVSSSSTQQLALDIVASGGLVALVLPPSITPPNDKRFSPIFAGVRCSWNEKLFQSLYLKVHKWIEDGFIIPNRHEALPDGLNGIFEGLARMERDEVSRLKLVAHPQETI